MPSVPVPVFTLAILLMLLAKVSLSGSDCYRRATMFLAGCALLLLLAALRWSFDFQALRQLQSLVAVILPPLAWRCFHERPRPQPLRQNLMLYAPAVAALSVNLVFPAAADVALAALYLGYGTALLRTSRKGSDAFSQSRLSDAPMAARLAFGAGAFLCFSGLTDIAIAIDFSLFSGQQAPMLVAASQIVLLPFICFAIVLPVRKRAQPAPVAVSNLSEKTSDVVQDAQRCAQLEETLRERSLYLNPDLTLDLLARKTGTPARHISRAVNATRGCNVSQWINSFRIAHAQQLLHQTASPVTEVMLASGFNTKSNFNREFSRIVGMSPVEYRRAAADNAASDSETRLSAP
ncbi:helix-turn-helix transcriptional regulator [Cronobacter malonaticus]|uniref:helix-turn-helix domain-containing protein n=1 Tax=Cronobacter malonaticus TaxID=413503 RepID=UPI0009488E3A|nr:AraC family transcriptional regulator [Cronobacter malonaticus]EGT4448180.1 AraC family transcriptional regulator [Cronobacter malonaticus]EKP4391716.1 helix-turn-helix transcriptional regulator [Cronobacter malonaticus]ELY2515306.1 helix-turn-helix transcriptional regulator [Cronobacter malonaticus]ELY4584554.1 helix-turn-helix transcriptional regulator [Cronobacter malonaticus]ELY4807065.1 helix-turn-helix transcriptional regulator [Cronobacter malonaticus]